MWDRVVYIKEVEKELGDKAIYEEVFDEPRPLISAIHKVIETNRKRGGLNTDTIK